MFPPLLFMVLPVLALSIIFLLLKMFLNSALYFNLSNVCVTCVTIMTDCSNVQLIFMAANHNLCEIHAANEYIDQ